MTDPNKTAIVAIIDESGSMGPRTSDVISGFKTMLDEQRKAPGECTVTVVKFKAQAEVLMVDRPLAEVGELDYKPGGWTALYDAVGAAIDSLGIKLAKLPEEQRPGRVMVLVITDGEENSSTKYNAPQVKLMREHQEKKYGWTFNFLGTDPMALKGAMDLGIDASNMALFAGNNTRAAFANYGKKSAFARSAAPSMVSSLMAYDAGDRQDLVSAPDAQPSTP